MRRSYKARIGNAGPKPRFRRLPAQNGAVAIWKSTVQQVTAILHGVGEKDVSVSVRNNQLVIEGERKTPEGFDKNAFTQLAYGKFYSALTLPTGLDRRSCELPPVERDSGNPSACQRGEQAEADSDSDRRRPQGAPRLSQLVN